MGNSTKIMIGNTEIETLKDFSLRIGSLKVLFDLLLGTRVEKVEEDGKDVILFLSNGSRLKIGGNLE